MVVCILTHSFPAQIPGVGLYLPNLGWRTNLPQHFLWFWFQLGGWAALDSGSELESPFVNFFPLWRLTIPGLCSVLCWPGWEFQEKWRSGGVQNESNFIFFLGGYQILMSGEETKKSPDKGRKSSLCASFCPRRSSLLWGPSNFFGESQSIHFLRLGLWRGSCSPTFLARACLVLPEGWKVTLSLVWCCLLLLWPV